jgi:hypothetical protein
MDITRCVVSFDLSSLPAEAQIQSAVLRICRNDQSNGDSYADPAGLGAVLVDNISYTSITPDADLDSIADTDGGVMGDSSTNQPELAVTYK